MKNSSKLLFLILLIFIQAKAFHFTFFPLNAEQRFIENQNKEMRFISATNLAVELSHDLHQVIFEKAEFKEHSGNSTLNFDEKNEEYHVSYLHEVYHWSQLLSLHFGLGIGQYNSSVKTNYLNTTTEDNSGNTLLASGIVSTQIQYQYLHGQFDFKLIQAKDYNPQPQACFVLRLGVRF